MSDKPRSVELDEQRMRDYLLGDLPPSESADVETQVFDSDADYDRLLDAQYDLIDAYARGALSPSERQAVEQRLLAHPDGRRRVALARALSARSAVGGSSRESAAAQPSAARTDPGGSRISRLALAAGFVLAAAGIGWLAMDNARLRRELNARTPSASPASPTPSPVPTLADASTPPMVEFALAARVPRSEPAVRTIEIPNRARLARLRLEMKDTAPSFTIAVERAGIGRVWTQRHEGAPQAGELVLWLPAEILSSGDYELLVWRGLEAADTLIGVYPFRVARR